VARTQQKREHPKEKLQLHQRNRHRERYNFKELIASCPELAQFVLINDYNDESIDFFNPDAVKMLNKALLKHFYGIDHWDIPQGYLCPPIPGRVDYIHYVADLLGNCNQGVIPIGNWVQCLDIGVGANCVYPIVGSREYGWSFVGSDIDTVAIQSASKIVEANSVLKGAVDLRLQSNPSDIFRGIFQKGEHFDITICNPPFHSSLGDAQSGNLRKLSNLNLKRVTKPTLNFGGKSNELWCEGGEERFVRNMIFQSQEFSASCLWFSTLISKQTNLDSAYKILQKVGVSEVRTIPMGQGNKISRIVAWTFLAHEEQQKWAETKWSR
jgi:23S rRNA (adenine1618-N6)-methyltransferase